MDSPGSWESGQPMSLSEVRVGMGPGAGHSIEAQGHAELVVEAQDVGDSVGLVLSYASMLPHLGQQEGMGSKGHRSKGNVSPVILHRVLAVYFAQ